MYDVLVKLSDDSTLDELIDTCVTNRIHSYNLMYMYAHKGHHFNCIIKINVYQCIIIQFQLTLHSTAHGLPTFYLILDNILRWRCADLMRFMTLQVALFFSNGICAGVLQYAFCFVYR